jgi:hypothetical protein
VKYQEALLFRSYLKKPQGRKMPASMQRFLVNLAVSEGMLE